MPKLFHYPPKLHLLGMLYVFSLYQKTITSTLRVSKSNNAMLKTKFGGLTFFLIFRFQFQKSRIAQVQHFSRSFFEGYIPSFLHLQFGFVYLWKKTKSCLWNVGEINYRRRYFPSRRRQGNSFDHSWWNERRLMGFARWLHLREGLSFIKI